MGEIKEIPAFRVKLGQIHHNLPFAAWLRIQRSKDDLGTMISMSARTSRKTEREIPRASSGPTMREMSSRWPVVNSVDGYLRFLDMRYSSRENDSSIFPETLDSQNDPVIRHNFMPGQRKDLIQQIAEEVEP